MAAVLSSITSRFTSLRFSFELNLFIVSSPITPYPFLVSFFLLTLLIPTTLYLHALELPFGLPRADSATSSNFVCTLLPISGFKVDKDAILHNSIWSSEFAVQCTSMDKFIIIISAIGAGVLLARLFYCVRLKFLGGLTACLRMVPPTKGGGSAPSQPTPTGTAEAISTTPSLALIAAVVVVCVGAGAGLVVAGSHLWRWATHTPPPEPPTPDWVNNLTTLQDRQTIFENACTNYERALNSHNGNAIFAARGELGASFIDFVAAANALDLAVGSLPHNTAANPLFVEATRLNRESQEYIARVQANIFDPEDNQSLIEAIFNYHPNRSGRWWDTVNNKLDAAIPNQLNFQISVTDIMEKIVDLHHDLIFFIIVITVFVSWMLGRMLHLYNSENTGKYRRCGASYANLPPIDAVIELPAVPLPHPVNNPFDAAVLFPPHPVPSPYLAAAAVNAAPAHPSFAALLLLGAIGGAIGGAVSFATLYYYVWGRSVPITVDDLLSQWNQLMDAKRSVRVARELGSDGLPVFENHLVREFFTFQRTRGLFKVFLNNYSGPRLNTYQQLDAFLDRNCLVVDTASDSDQLITALLDISFESGEIPDFFAAVHQDNAYACKTKADLSPDIDFINALVEQDTVANLRYGILFLLALSSLGVYSIILAGWSSNSKYAFIGALRSAAIVQPSYYDTVRPTWKSEFAVQRGYSLIPIIRFIIIGPIHLGDGSCMDRRAFLHAL